jgi:hypothetical protein
MRIRIQERRALARSQERTNPASPYGDMVKLLCSGILHLPKERGGLYTLYNPANLSTPVSNLVRIST